MLSGSVKSQTSVPNGVQVGHVVFHRGGEKKKGFFFFFGGKALCILQLFYDTKIQTNFEKQLKEHIGLQTPNDIR